MAFTNIVNTLNTFKNTVLVWLQSEEVVAEALAAELVSAVETVLTALKPSVIADIRTILVSLPADFTSGSDFASIVEEVKIKAEADLKAVLDTAKPQILEAIVGVLINALVVAH